MYVAHFLAAVWYGFVAWLCWLATVMFWEEDNTIAWMLCAGLLLIAVRSALKHFLLFAETSSR